MLNPPVPPLHQPRAGFPSALWGVGKFGKPMVDSFQGFVCYSHMTDFPKIMVPRAHRRRLFLFFIFYFLFLFLVFVVRQTNKQTNRPTNKYRDIPENEFGG
jgi:hypothetical protein